jgi:predicted HTH domain antitoxin
MINLNHVKRYEKMQISFPLPEGQFVADSQEGVTEKVRLYAALGLYRAGELSIGAACELAGVDRYIFLDFCKRERVTIRTQTPEELGRDIDQLLVEE